VKESKTSVGQPIKVGVITDQTGPLSVMGIANANVAKMVISDINAKGGLLGRQIDLYLEDSATTDSVAEAKATKLAQQDHCYRTLVNPYLSGEDHSQAAESCLRTVLSFGSMAPRLFTILKLPFFAWAMYMFIRT
jgi:ABC-type branched-subunit amino acid transport system substrate-binding protein